MKYANLNKTEIKSLLLIVAAVVGFVFVFQMEYGNARKWVSLLSMALLAMSIDPTFSWRRKSSSQPKEQNRVGRAIGYVIAAAAVIILLIGLSIAPFISEVDGGTYIFIVIFFSFVLMIGVWSYFSPRGWLSRRLRWLTDKGEMPIYKEGKGRAKEFYNDDNEDGIAYCYRPAERLFYVERTMFLNPARFEKEYAERRYQFQTRLEQTHLPLELGISKCKSCMNFRTSVAIFKQYATKENVCRIRDVIKDLSKEDYNCPLFSKFTFGNNTMYLETVHYKVLRIMLVVSDVLVECYSPQKATVKPSEQLAGIFEHIREDGLMDELQPNDLVEAEEFERIWNSGF